MAHGAFSRVLPEGSLEGFPNGFWKRVPEEDSWNAFNTYLSEYIYIYIYVYHIYYLYYIYIYIYIKVNKYMNEYMISK